ncbi:MAG: hypothetical protein IKK06_06865 [Clostridia bacterium]|nr:hypothetical protein [Clostridia bacterium]
MKSFGEQLNNAFGGIDDRFILSAQNPPKSEKRILLGSIAAALCVLLVLIPFLVTQGTFLRGDGWEQVFYEAATLQKKKTGPYGTLCMMTVNLGDISGVTEYQPAEDVCLEMFGQWLFSWGSMDYSLQFSLFPEEHLESYVYQEFEKAGYTKEQGMEKISQTASELFPFRKVEIQYTVTAIKRDDPELTRRFFQRINLEKAGIDPNEVTSVLHYSFEQVRLYYDGLLSSGNIFDDELGSGVYFYEYKGKWYLAPNMLEDDMSIDLLHAGKKKPSTYYEQKKLWGTITSIENGYICIDDSFYFFADEELAKGYREGDSVSVRYYNAVYRMERIEDGKKCKVARAVSIKKEDPS